MTRRRIRFYKSKQIDNEFYWFADLPEYLKAGGEVEMLVMVDGADTWLDYISGNNDEVTLDVADEPFGDADHITMFTYDPDGVGASYVAGVFEGNVRLHTLWLCSVTTFLFGTYPPVIFYKRVNTGYDRLFRQ